MKHIRKRGAPHKYITWRKKVRGTNDEDYRRLSSPLKATLHKALIEEQGGLCAYTMKRVCMTDSHIEHIKPESICRAKQPGSDLDYQNLVACYPKEGMGRRYRYGAQHKGNWWANNGVLFVSPLEPACEKRFRFDLAGEIHAVKNCISAITTIDVLKLDHKSLTEERKRAIEVYIYGENGDDPLSKTKVQMSRRHILNLAKDGYYHVFCVAILHALDDHERNLNVMARRKRYSTRGR